MRVWARLFRVIHAHEYPVLPTPDHEGAEGDEGDEAAMSTAAASTAAADEAAAVAAEGEEEREDMAKEEKAHLAHQHEFFCTCEQLMLRAEASSPY